MSSRRRVELYPLGDPQRFQDLALALTGEGRSLRELLRAAPALALAPLTPEVLDTPLAALRVRAMRIDANTPLYRPDIDWRELATAAGAGGGVRTAAETPAATGSRQAAAAPALAPVSTSADEPDAGPAASRAASPDVVRPSQLSDGDAVRLAYADDIDDIASFLRTELSVLVFCDKLVVRHLWPPIVRAAGLEALELSFPGADDDAPLARSLRRRQLDQLRALLRDTKRGQALVLPYLDLLGGGGERTLSPEARELVELLYEWPERLLLGFADRSMPLSDILADRFAIRPQLSGVPRQVPVVGRSSEVRRAALGDALVTTAEAACFRDYDPHALYKHVAGLNPLRLRHAVTYAVERARADGHDESRPAPAEALHGAIRTFKAQTSDSFAIPHVQMDDIGGYQAVKAVLQRALSIVAGQFTLPDEALRRELIPRGFLLHGPPGTGKTLFAKAVATQLEATIRVVSGPEVTDMFVGESERRVRELFAEARRNAPSVLVFDEFDAIAASRTGRNDGGNRAGNAMVAQILTEMDGFRPDVAMLVIGTTNRIELIDEALLRPSRFQPIAIGLPDRDARRQIAAIHARHFHVDVDTARLDLVADHSAGMNGDQIRAIFRDACLGTHCHEPPIAPTAERLLALIQALRADVIVHPSE